MFKEGYVFKKTLLWSICFKIVVIVSHLANVSRWCDGFKLFFFLFLLQILFLQNGFRINKKNKRKRKQQHEEVFVLQMPQTDKYDDDDAVDKDDDGDVAS